MIFVAGAQCGNQCQCLKEVEEAIIRCANNGGSPATCGQLGFLLYCFCMTQSGEPLPEGCPAQNFLRQVFGDAAPRHWSSAGGRLNHQLIKIFTGLSLP
jgi:hypothetical protein